jgi:hypothetical protein
MTDFRIPLPNDRFLLVREKGISIYDNDANPETDSKVRDLDEYEEMHVRAAWQARGAQQEPVAWIAPHRLKGLQTGIPQTVYMKATNSDTVPLYTSPPAQPNSVTMPREPTPEMLEAAHKALPVGFKHMGYETLGKVYKAMIAAQEKV